MSSSVSPAYRAYCAAFVSRWPDALMLLAVSAALAMLIALPARAQEPQAWYPLTGEDGTAITNYRVPVELESEVEKLPNIVVVGNPNGDVTLAEFYDLNCPYCRKAAADLTEIVKADPQLRLVLVPFPVLGVPSIQAGRVEFVLAKLASPQQFFDFNHRIFSGRGTVDGARALAVAEALGFPPDKVTAAADQDSVTKAMITHVKLGNALGLAATPSFIIKGTAIVGYPGAKTLTEVIRAVRRCDKVVC